VLGAAAGAGLVAGGGAAGFAVAGGRGGDAGGDAGTVPFYGAHQAGITTAQQDRLAFAAFDITTRDVRQLAATLGQWSAAAARMTAGQLVGPTMENPHAPPVDTGEALGLPPSRLTVTVGFGASLFDDRFGLAAKRPAALAPLPPLPGDVLDPRRSGGDLCVQACADDPQVAFHAVRNLARIARGCCALRWTQLGFGRTSSTTSAEQTPRNLLGFKDGTNNIKAEDTAALAEHVWVGSETDQAWLRGGSYLVTRRIRMEIESWDADYAADQQNVIGRFKNSGAPLTGEHEFDPVNLNARDHAGSLVIPGNAHIRLASPVSNGGIRILRRGYSYTDGIDPATSELDAGLFFIAFVRDAHRQFVPLQTRLGANDALNEYIRHTGSALFACPPGLRQVGDWFARELFADVASVTDVS
jgi:deferrochelatase/peroxidase EfeB